MCRSIKNGNPADNNITSIAEFCAQHLDANVIGKRTLG